MIDRWGELTTARCLLISSNDHGCQGQLCQCAKASALQCRRDPLGLWLQGWDGGGRNLVEAGTPDPVVFMRTRLLRGSIFPACRQWDSGLQSQPTSHFYCHCQLDLLLWKLLQLHAYTFACEMTTKCLPKRQFLQMKLGVPKIGCFVLCWDSLWPNEMTALLKHCLVACCKLLVPQKCLLWLTDKPLETNGLQSPVSTVLLSPSNKTSGKLG